MLFPSQFNITKIYLELEHDALKKEFSDVLNSEEYIYIYIYIYILYIYNIYYIYIHYIYIHIKLLTVISTIVGLKP